MDTDQGHGSQGSATEQWRHLAAWPNYEASDQGRVRRIDSGRIKKGTPDPDGYLIMKLSHDGRTKVRFVHRLICTAFHGCPPTAQHLVAHWDGNKTNNVPSNLRWATQKENIADQFRHGTVSRGSKHPGAVLTEEIVLDIRRRLALPNAPTLKRLADENGVDPVTIKAAATGRKWRHVGGPIHHGRF